MAFPNPQGPLLGQTKVDKFLSQISLFYSNETYIAEMVAPVLKVVQKTGIVPKYGKENLKVYVGQGLRLPGQRAAGFNYSVNTSDKYACFEHSFEKQVPWELAANQDDPYDAKRDATKVATDLILQNQEYAMAQFMSNASVLTNNTTLSAANDKWSSPLTSDPIDDINTGIDAVRLKIARRPNSLTLSYPVFKTLKAHPKIRDAVKYTNGGQLSDADMGNFLKQFFNLKNIFVGEAVGDLTIEGQDPVLTELWGKNAWLHYTTPSPSILTPTFAYTFFDLPRVVDTYPVIEEKSDYVRVSYSFDQHFCDVNAAYAIFAAIA